MGINLDEQRTPAAPVDRPSIDRDNVANSCFSFAPERPKGNEMERIAVGEFRSKC
jgi:hypothetical protein